MLEGYLPVPEMTHPLTPITVNTSPIVHTAPFVLEPIYDVAPSEGLGIHGRMDGYQDQFEELQKEMKALCGKELFGNNVHDLCLVPNVKVPAKFKLPESEKCQGNSCPQ